MTEAAPPPPPPPGLPPQPPALARAIALDLVTRLRLRLTDPRDSRLGPLGAGMYELGAAAWTGRRAAFVGFYTPPTDPMLAGPDLAARCAAAATWGIERLAVQGAERCDILIIALGHVPGALSGLPPHPAVQVGAVSVDPTTAEVSVALAPPADLVSPREVRAIAVALRDGKEPPTLAAVDLAERQAVAGGYAAPARTQLASRPVATYALIASFVAVFIIEKALLRDPGAVYFLGALDNLGADWWRYVSYAFLHDPGGGSFGVSGLPTHVIFNSIAMYIVGRLVEQLYGWRVLLATFLVTAVGAGIASVIVADIGNSETLTLGASGGIMGLLGLLFMLGRVQGREVPVGIAHAMRQYAITYGAMVVIFGFLITNTNNVAHVGGFAFGVAVGAVLPPLARVGGRELQRWEQVAVYAVYALAALAVIVWVANVVPDLGSNPVFRTAPGA